MASQLSLLLHPHLLQCPLVPLDLVIDDVPLLPQQAELEVYLSSEVGCPVSDVGDQHNTCECVLTFRLCSVSERSTSSSGTTSMVRHPTDLCQNSRGHLWKLELSQEAVQT